LFGLDSSRLCDIISLKSVSLLLLFIFYKFLDKTAFIGLVAIEEKFHILAKNDDRYCLWAIISAALVLIFEFMTLSVNS
jgi:hypothetical protein